MIKDKLLFFLLSLFLLSFAPAGNTTFEFAYPKRKGTAISFNSAHFKKFTKEWRGSDYYYYSEDSGFICSVLYYKLTGQEQKELIEMPHQVTGGPDISPAYPYAYFKNYSNLKTMESNDSSWGKADDDFMFRQNDVTVEGVPIVQKNMYGYAMAGKDLFINVHLSKLGCTAADSVDMMNLLSSLAFKDKMPASSK